MKKLIVLSFAFAFASAVLAEALNNPALKEEPKQENDDKKCDCPCNEQKDEVTQSCVKVSLALGRTTAPTGRRRVSLRIYTSLRTPEIFTPSELRLVMDYTFAHLGQGRRKDGSPSEVVFVQAGGEELCFRFAEGASLGVPDPGVHVALKERLQMVDAEGWAAPKDPVYYDLYPGDGSVWRFLATDLTRDRGALVSYTDPRGQVTTAADFGVGVVRDASGRLRQVVTPSRLADIVPSSATSYTVTVYPLVSEPAVDAATGLYVLPALDPVSRLTVARGADDGELLVGLAHGTGDPRNHVYRYQGGDWALYTAGGLCFDRTVELGEDEGARAVNTVKDAASGALLRRTEYRYEDKGWGLAMVSRSEGTGDRTRLTEWTYVESGAARGKPASERSTTGRNVDYGYDANGRLVTESRPDLGWTTSYSYAPVAPGDPALMNDVRPRTVVKTMNGIEVERTYRAYPTNGAEVVERAAAPGAAYGAAGNLRTVRTWYAPNGADASSGLLESVRSSDGSLDCWSYAAADGAWVETVTHLHENAPAGEAFRTTRDVTVYDRAGNVAESRTELMTGADAWTVIARSRYARTVDGKVSRVEDLLGRVTTAEWGGSCCGKASETLPDGRTTTFAYDADGRLVAQAELCPSPVETHYERDILGQTVATWTTNRTARLGTPVVRVEYDEFGRIVGEQDARGNWTRTAYSADGLVTTVTNPNGSTRITTRDVAGRLVSVTGTAITPEFHSYGAATNGLRWSKTVLGAESSGRFTTEYENMLGQSVRTERSGCNGATLVSTAAYDSHGHLVSTVEPGAPAVSNVFDALGEQVATIQTVGNEWRRSSSGSAYALIDGEIWRTSVTTQSCSDASIAPLVVSSREQVTGLTAAQPSRSLSVDVHGNITETWTTFDAATKETISHRRIPTASNVAFSVSRYGQQLKSVSASAVTNTAAYDGLDRQIARTDGRGNTTTTAYDSFGQAVSVTDAAGAVTRYAYDALGQLVAVTNALGNATEYAYDVRGNKVYEGGATYPVTYAYDLFNVMTNMTTYRTEPTNNAALTGSVQTSGQAPGDVTTWIYDAASGTLAQKLYADGHGPSYTYTDTGRLATRTWARGIVTTYAYDGWGSLTNTASDETPTVSIAYDAIGRQLEATDAAGMATFAYDQYGANTNEAVTGVAGTNVIERFYDTFGRDVGYALNGVRQSTLGYDPATGRLATMIAVVSDVPFAWSYLPGSDLKSSLSYPNGLTASWIYDNRGNLLQVKNATATNVISQYDYTYDAASRRISVAKSGSAFANADTIDYGYNMRNELTNAEAQVDGDYKFSYGFDDIGNRETATEPGTNTTYAANSLNQYTEILSQPSPVSQPSQFVPAFDADGNQTLVKTVTGIWQVTYNGENRPVLWTFGTNTITMSYDRMGRRVTKNAQRFVYNGYLQIANHQSPATNHQFTIWDPTESIATRPLVLTAPTANHQSLITSYYTLDGNKNVSEVVSVDGSVTAHYDYTPFGATTGRIGENAGANKFRFSSEYADDELKLVYYNYRHYDAVSGRWLSRDPICELDQCLYCYCENMPVNSNDLLGLARALTGNLSKNYKDWYSGHKEARNLLRYLYENVETIVDDECRKCYEIIFKDLALADIEELKIDIKNNSQNVFLIGHGSLLVNGKRWGQKQGEYERQKGDHVQSLIARHVYDPSPIVLNDLGNVEMKNVFGCYLSDYLRAYDKDGNLARSMYEDWSRMYEEMQRRFEEKYGKNKPLSCPYPQKIIIYEGEWKGLLNGNKGTATEKTKALYPPKAEDYYKKIQQDYFVGAKQ